MKVTSAGFAVDVEEAAEEIRKAAFEPVGEEGSGRASSTSSKAGLLKSLRRLKPPRFM